MTTNDKKSAITDSVDGQPSASQPESTNEHDETQVRQSTPSHAEPPEDMIPASYLLKLLKDSWIQATDAAWRTGEVAANRGAVLAERFSSRIEQALDGGGHVISYNDLLHLITSPLQKGQTPQETFRTFAFAERPRPFPGAATVRMNHDTIEHGLRYRDDRHDDQDFDPRHPF